MTDVKIQSFLIHRHGARFNIKPPEHNVVWPSENKFWRSHVGKLTPVGVIEMSNLGQYFRKRYPWVTVNNLTVFSTHRSRALESAWSFLLGLLPSTPIKFETMKTYQTCNEPICCGGDICCIHYYHRGDDLIFGQGDPSMAYKINVNNSSFLQQLAQCPKTAALIHRLTEKGYFRLRRDAVTTVAKLKDIHSQLCIDAQLRIPAAGSLTGKYDLTDEEISLIAQVGNEVICRRLIPSTDSLSDPTFNEDQGKGIINTIAYLMSNWNRMANEFRVFSCHDTNLIAMMSLLGLKIIPPDFAGYILIERMVTDTEDVVAVYYCPSPFKCTDTTMPRVWPSVWHRSNFMNWDELSVGMFSTSDFLQVFQPKTA